MRIGHGYDVHRLKEGRELVLCGEKIEHSMGLDGHSDADVALHALMDALLGALALGDIGMHFPDTDERYRGISSIELLKQVNGIIAEHGFYISNADLTIAAQKPRLAPYIMKMRENISEAVGVDISRISVKATTTEGLGFEGEQLGISATAVCLLEEV